MNTSSSVQQQCLMKLKGLLPRLSLVSMLRSVSARYLSSCARMLKKVMRVDGQLESSTASDPLEQRVDLVSSQPALGRVHLR